MFDNINIQISIAIILIVLIFIVIGFVISDRVKNKFDQEERKIRELRKINMREERKEIEKELNKIEGELIERMSEYDRE